MTLLAHRNSFPAQQVHAAMGGSPKLLLMEPTDSHAHAGCPQTCTRSDHTSQGRCERSKLGCFRRLQEGQALTVCLTRLPSLLPANVPGGQAWAQITRAQV